MFDSLSEVVRCAAVRVCLDTAHAFAAGYDPSMLEGADGRAQKNLGTPSVQLSPCCTSTTRGTGSVGVATGTARYRDGADI